MKKTLIVVLALIMVLGLVACSSTPATETNTTEPTETTLVETVEPTPEPTPEEVVKTDYMEIEGIYVDSSYLDDENDKYKMVYVFYTVSTDAENLKLSSNGLTLVINDINKYPAEHYSKACKYMDSYYYSSYVEDLVIGDSMKVVSTFKIPEGDLVSGKSLTLESSSIPDAGNILMSTDNIVSYNGAEEIAKIADPNGYAIEVDNMQDADEDTVAKVKAAINGYYWKCAVNSTSYRLEFSSPDKFEMSAMGGSNMGTYIITKGYIICEYESNGYIVEIPYKFGDSSIELSLTKALDVNKN